MVGVRLGSLRAWELPSLQVGEGDPSQQGGKGRPSEESRSIPRPPHSRDTPET